MEGINEERYAREIKKNERERERENMYTEFCPWNEAPRTVGQVEGIGREGKPLGGDDAQDSWNAAFEGELDLSLVVVPRCQRESENSAIQQITSPACHLQRPNCIKRPVSYLMRGGFDESIGNDRCIGGIEQKEGSWIQGRGGELSYPASRVDGSPDSSVLHSRDQGLHQIDVCTDSFGEHGAAARENELLTFFSQPVLIRFLVVYPVVWNVSGDMSEE